MIRYKEKDFQRDAGMIMLEKARSLDVDPAVEDRFISEPHYRRKQSETTQHIGKGSS